MKLRRVLIILFVLCLAVGVTALGASAAEIVASGECGAQGDNVTWTLDDEGTLTISGEGEMAGFYLPSTSGGSAPWYSACGKIKNVIIDEGVTSIGSCAFYDCMLLLSIDIPDTVVSIGHRAFYNCASIDNIALPDNVTSIETGIFYGCSKLESVILPNGIDSIGTMAFQGCESLINIVIPEGVTSIGYGAFANCSSLTRIVIPNSVTSIGDCAFAGCVALKGVKIPDSITCIGESVFDLCISLTEIVIPDSVTGIGRSAFSQCHGLTKIIIPDSVTSIGGCAFYDCGSLTNIVIPEGVTSIGSSAFYKCSSLTKIVIPEGVTSIGGGAFANCSSLTKIVIPDSVTSIGDEAFFYCSNLTGMVIPDSVTSIGDDAFYRCSRLTEIVIPDSVTSIGDYAFAYCYALKELVFQGDVPSIGSKTFSSVKATAYYPVDNDTWNKSVRQHYGGTIVWKSTCVGKHTWIDATCYEPKSCSVCEMTEGAALGHDEIVHGAKASTCTESGWNKYITCFRCDYSTYKAKAPLGHDCQNGICTRCASVLVKITTQPKTTYTKNGGTAKVTVKASGDGLSYTWYAKDKGAEKYTKTSVTKATYSVTMNNKSKDRIVYCVIKDKYGNKVQTKKVPLRMAASITTQPKNASAKVGAKAKTTVKAMGDGLTYTWYVKDKGDSKFTKSSLKTATYSVKMSKSNNGRQVYCVVKDKYGKKVTSDTVTLGIAVKITSQPKTSYTKSGKTAKATVKATGDGLTYTWYVKNKGATKYTKSSITKATYSVTMNSKSKDRLVYCVIKDKYGNKVQTETVRLRMAATVTTQPKDVMTAKGKTAKITVKAAGDGLTYTWYIKNPGASKFSKSSVKSATYSCKVSKSNDGRQVYCVVKDKYGKTAKTKTATIYME